MEMRLFPDGECQSSVANSGLHASRQLGIHFWALDIRLPLAHTRHEGDANSGSWISKLTVSRATSLFSSALWFIVYLEIASLSLRV